jgi:hypothetical protein
MTRSKQRSQGDEISTALEQDLRCGWSGINLPCKVCSGPRWPPARMTTGLRLGGSRCTDTIWSTVGTVSELTRTECSRGSRHDRLNECCGDKRADGKDDSQQGYLGYMTVSGLKVALSAHPHLASTPLTKTTHAPATVVRVQARRVATRAERPQFTARDREQCDVWTPELL